MWLSVEAEKAQQEGRDRAKGFAPTLARTATSAVILRPRAYRGGPAARDFAKWVKVTLPQFAFDAKKDCWLAPLDQLSKAHAALTDRGAFCNVTDGARQELDRIHQAVDPDPTLPTVDVNGHVIVKRPAEFSKGDFDVIIYSTLPTLLYDSRVECWTGKADDLARIVKVLKKRLGGCNVTLAVQTLLK